MIRQMIATGLFITFCASHLFAQAPADLKKLENRLAKLDAKVLQLDARKRVDAEICSKAVEWILRHNEFYRPNYVQLSHLTLELGEQRVEAIDTGKIEWANATGVFPVGYRSVVDESVQPYIVSLPKGFNAIAAKRWPLYVVLHGRNSRLTEASFIGGALHQDVPEYQTWIQIDVFGRVNNAYRWAGETDVFEAIADVSRRFRIDESRLTIWGFSMGGAGAWHLGLHHPSKWASAGAGAGFVDFYKYQKQERLPEHQHKALRIYDALDYSQNLNIVPFIAYGGELDKQLQSAKFVQEEAANHDIELNIIVGPKMGHKFDPDSKSKFMEFLGKHNELGRNRVPGKREFDFVTYTLKYNQCEWLEIQEQLKAYEKTKVSSAWADDGVLELTTENIASMSLLRTAADRVRIDGAGPFELNLIADGNLIEVYFIKDGKGWQTLDYEDSLEFETNPYRNKRHDLQGPIDDAFMQPFVCVTGTDQAWSKELDDYAVWSMKRFEKEFDKWMRAKPVVLKDSEIQESTIKSKNLILFGDPGSNRILRRVVEELPIEWTKQSLTVGGQTYSTGDCCPVMIFPNPLNPGRYVVINSGMTTHEKDFKASNSWLFPKLGDHAVIRFKRLESGEYEESVLEAGLFDANWNR